MLPEGQDPKEGNRPESPELWEDDTPENLWAKDMQLQEEFDLIFALSLDDEESPLTSVPLSPYLGPSTSTARCPDFSSYDMGAGPSGYVPPARKATVHDGQPGPSGLSKHAAQHSSAANAGPSADTGNGEQTSTGQAGQVERPVEQPNHVGYLLKTSHPLETANTERKVYPGQNGQVEFPVHVVHYPSRVQQPNHVEYAICPHHASQASRTYAGRAGFSEHVGKPHNNGHAGQDVHSSQTAAEVELTQHIAPSQQPGIFQDSGLSQNAVTSQDRRTFHEAGPSQQPGPSRDSGLSQDTRPSRRAAPSQSVGQSGVAKKSRPTGFTGFKGHILHVRHISLPEAHERHLDHDEQRGIDIPTTSPRLGSFVRRSPSFDSLGSSSSTCSATSSQMEEDFEMESD